ncbi:MAG TPA: alpha/beta fold hydrolase [bacterium]|nr:alpha/beta fold hydrolase [bacterium]
MERTPRTAFHQVNPIATPSRHIRFRGGAGCELAGRLDVPAGDSPLAIFLFAHAFGSSKDLRSTNRIVDFLTGKGCAVFRFDFTGVGQSEGDFASTSFTTNIADLMAAAETLRRELGPAEFLFGHSLGGLAALRSARQITECKGAATYAAPSSTLHLREILLRRAPGILEEGEAVIETIGKQARVSAAMLEDFAQHDALDDVRELGRAGKKVLVVQSLGDPLIDPAHGRRLFEAAGTDRMLAELTRPDHLLMAHDGDARQLGAILAGWAGL